MRRSTVLAIVMVSSLVATALAGCGRQDFDDAEKAKIQALSLASLPPLPADPTNVYSDDPGAAALGATLFFDLRFSRDGNVSCATCHKIDRQFQDDLPRGRGVGVTKRRTQPLAGVAWNAWLFWDGRRDSLWAQALTPLEDPAEHAGTRAFYARFMAEKFGQRYARIFGRLPDLSGVPERAGPFGTPAESAAWAALSEAQRDGVNRVFANAGKALAAFQRSLPPVETRFDRFALALAAGREPGPEDDLSAAERRGLGLFIGKARCSTCHAGPRFTDDKFHNTGVPPAADQPGDLGRQEGIALVRADPFNCLGAYSDGGPAECGKLQSLAGGGPEEARAFKTPSLRGAADRPPYMHAGQLAGLPEVLKHYSDAPVAASGTSEIEALALTARERADLIAFLGTISPP